MAQFGGGYGSGSEPAPDIGDPTKPPESWQPTPGKRPWEYYPQYNPNIGSSDPFARYAQQYYVPGLAAFEDPQSAGYDPALAEFFRSPGNAQATYDRTTNMLANNPDMSGGGRSYVKNRFNDVYNKYLAESTAAQGNGQAFDDFYTYSRNYDFGKDYYGATPQERGFSLGGGPGGRFQRNY